MTLVAGDPPVARTRYLPQPAATNISQVCHFQITPNGKPSRSSSGEFINALNRIRGIAPSAASSTSCSTARPATASTRPRSTSSDRRHRQAERHPAGRRRRLVVRRSRADLKKVILNGQSCGDAPADLGASVQIVIGCPTQVN
ncbi:MAG: hypothetical protein U0235_13695 [Polyangiaceae bacterium]